MTQIIDIGPTRSNTNASDIHRSVIGRMLSIACSPDGKALYSGSYSNLWCSEDGGQTWTQFTWPQPPPGQFDVPGALGGWCALDIAAALGWRVEKHPRFLTKLTKSGFLDILGFGDCGVWTAVGRGDGSFDPPKVVIPNFGYHAGGWHVDKNPRFLVDLNNDGCADIVGFGDDGVWTVISNRDGTFQAPRFVVPDFGHNQGWREGKHPRFLAVTTKSGFLDIVGFGDAGVSIAYGNGDGTFDYDATKQPVWPELGYSQGWRVDKHPRLVVDIDGDGCADLVGFGDDGLSIARSDGQGHFAGMPGVLDFGYNQGWRVDKHPRVLAVTTTSGFPDIVGFGDAGVYIAWGNGNGTFDYDATKPPVWPELGYSQGWRVNKHPRLVVDIDGDGCADLIGFGDDGVSIARSDGQRHFVGLPGVLDFGYNQGWRIDRHPRFLADLTGKGQPSIVGFGDAGVFVARNNDDNSGSFTYDPGQQPVIPDFGYSHGWRIHKHPRLLADLRGDGQASIVGFGEAGVWTALGDGQGGFPASNFIVPNFGYGTIVLALMAADRAANGQIGPNQVSGTRGIWRSTDGGSTWQLVYQFPGNSNPHILDPTPNPARGQLEWALGSDHLVYAAGKTCLAISENAGQTFANAFPWGSQGPFSHVNHVAVWQNSPADPFPAVIYALGDGTMFLSFDGGTTWIRDNSPVPTLPVPSGVNVGGATSPTVDANSAKVMVISPRNALEVFIAQDGSVLGAPAVLCRGDYSQFPLGDQTSLWDPVPLPVALTDASTQDSGNVFLAVTQRGRGDLLFYGAQRSIAYVGPLSPQSGHDWARLGPVHEDLHGLLLSPDFKASITSGEYHPGSGTVWLLSDGGIHRSTQGGQTFDPAQVAQTLACLSVAGVAVSGKPPALALNMVDNAGLYSMDGGEHWSYLEYNGGDNEAAFADPFRPNSLLVFTPRRLTNGDTVDDSGNPVRARAGQTVSVYETQAGKLPNASEGGHDRRAVTGPPIVDDTNNSPDAWNASGGYATRGSRPVVLGLPAEDPPTQGDYVFILLNPALLPTDDNGHPRPLLVRTQRILDIAHREEWVPGPNGLGPGGKVFQQGPPLPPGLNVVQASGGHSNTVFYAGGDGTLWTWTNGAPGWTQLVPTPANAAMSVSLATRFFVSPYNPKLIYVLDVDAVKRSDDGGQTWQVDQSLTQQLTWNALITIADTGDVLGLFDNFDTVLTDMQFAPVDFNVRFAIGVGGAFATVDGGVTWSQLLHTGALAGRPSSCYYDASSSSSPALYVAFAGRSLVKITDLPSPVIF
jgi:hypothetical protein